MLKFSKNRAMLQSSSLIPKWKIPVFHGMVGEVIFDSIHFSIFLCYLKVTGIVLRGIFLLRKKEIDWFYEGGAAAIYPDGILSSLAFVLH